MEPNNQNNFNQQQYRPNQNVRATVNPAATPAAAPMAPAVQQPVQAQQPTQPVRPQVISEVPTATVTDAQPQKTQQPVPQPAKQPVPDTPLNNPRIDDFSAAPVENVPNTNPDAPETDLNTVLADAVRAYQEGELQRTNLKDMNPAFPLSRIADITRYEEEEMARHHEDIRSILADMSSDIHAILNCQSQFTNNFTLLTDALKKVEKPDEQLKRHVKGVGDSSANVFRNFKDDKVVTLTGMNGLMTLTALTDGLRRITLWNSGIYFNIRSIPLDILNAYYREVTKTDYEYGRDLGAFYYLYSDLTISEYIIEHLLPVAICGSNSANWKDMDQLKKVISWQDFQVILWAMAVMMHPNGINLNFVCGEPGCGHVQTEFVDLSKLHLVDSDKINDEMLEHFRKGQVTDTDLEEYRKICNLRKSIEFSYTVGNIEKHWKVNLRQASISDYAAVGRDYNSEVRKNCTITNQTEVQRYMRFNYFRCYKSWIDSMELTLTSGEDSKTFIINNDDSSQANDKAIYLLLNEFQLNYPKFDELMKEYILDTKLSHIAFYFPECPKCHKVPANGYHGYLPYDPVSGFFTLALRKLFVDAAGSTE